MTDRIGTCYYPNLEEAVAYYSVYFQPDFYPGITAYEVEAQLREHVQEMITKEAIKLGTPTHDRENGESVELVDEKPGKRWFICKARWDKHNKITFGDGATISIQASEGHYCKPQVDGEVPRTEVECGYYWPCETVPVDNEISGRRFEPLAKYNDGRGIYPNVPADLIVKLIEYHGGIKHGTHPELLTSDTVIATRYHGDTKYQLRHDGRLFTVGKDGYFCGHVSSPEHLTEAIENHEEEMRYLFAEAQEEFKNY